MQEQLSSLFHLPALFSLPESHKKSCDPQVGYSESMKFLEHSFVHGFLWC